MKLLLLFMILMQSAAVLAQGNIAIVKIVRGEVSLLMSGKTTTLKVDDWIQNGAMVKTAEKSFVKLVFVDKSQMNIGPASEMRIESFTGKDSGVIDLVQGKIRSQVSKDYLQIKDKNKSKLFIKTKNAVMGVRGTDFLISTNGVNTSTILFEGEVVFNKLEDRGEVSPQKLEEIVDRGVRIFPGEFSVMEGNRSIPTVPSLLNIQQRERLEKNQELSSDRSPSNSGGEVTKTIVPEGLSGQVVSSRPEALKKELNQVSSQQNSRPSASAPEGFVKNDQLKPANGSFVHIDSGVIIPPGKGAALDSNTNTFIPGPDSGRVSADGNYIPPKNMEITNEGKIFVAAPDASGSMVVRQILPPPPVMRVNSVAPQDPTNQVTRPGLPRADIPLPGAGQMDTRFIPNGGIPNVNAPERKTDFSQTTIILGP